MLILTRRLGEKIEIGDGIVVQVLDVQGRQVRIGIAAPKEVIILREEVREREEERLKKLKAPLELSKE